MNAIDFLGPYSVLWLFNFSAIIYGKKAWPFNVA